MKMHTTKSKRSIRHLLRNVLKMKTEPKIELINKGRLDTISKRGKADPFKKRYLK